MLSRKNKLEIPVYLFMGFLEAGKTTFIQETLEEDYFNDGERTLLFACEEGMEEYDELDSVYLSQEDKDCWEKCIRKYTDKLAVVKVMLGM